MRTRYFRDSTGKASIKAVVYQRADHNVSRSSIDLDARKICTRLNEQGHEAYIVGGAVRDLLLGRTPKDFDIATDASPSRVKRLFRNSRVIGKRFRLVHVFFRDGKIHEVATFRAPESGDRNHVYGSLYEDVMRRDFSLNALYYDPAEETILDFVNGVKDIRKGVIKSVLPLNSSFSEDPVRMLRAVKYAAITGMKISSPVGRRIKKDASLLATASLSRLSEELYKILSSRNSEGIMRLMERYSLIDCLLPNIPLSVREDTFLSLGKLDEMLISRDLSRGVMIYHLCGKALEARGVFEGSGKTGPVYTDILRTMKDLIKPLVQPNRDVEEAVRLMFKEHGLKIPRKRPRNYEDSDSTVHRRRHRRRKPSEAPKKSE